MRWNLLALTAGFVLDLILGDPRWLYHPVRAIGLLIDKGEMAFRRIFPKSRQGELTAGVFFAFFVVLVICQFLIFIVLYSVLFVLLF